MRWKMCVGFEIQIVFVQQPCQQSHGSNAFHRIFSGLELDPQVLRVSFRPTCGMAWNLILNASPADFQVACILASIAANCLWGENGVII